MQVMVDSASFTTEKKSKGIPGSTIKIIAVAAMLIDHISAALLTRILIRNGMMGMGMDMTANRQWFAENGVLYAVMFLMRLIGRIGFPIFCFLLVEGFQKTRSRVQRSLLAIISSSQCARR